MRIFLIASLLLFNACTAEVDELSLSDRYVMFTLNTQEFIYLDECVETVNRVIDIHEEYQVPVDIYLTEDIIRDYETSAPELIERLKESDMVAVSYHTRPPRPYNLAAYDFIGMDELPPDELYETLLDYEEHAVDRETGETTEDEGGYEHVKEVIGYAPIVVGMPIGIEEKEMRNALAEIYKQKGATFVVMHRDVDLGEQHYGFFVRPEHIEVKLFEHVGEDAVSLIETLWEESTFPTPTFMSIKVHDNDFIATASAWTSIYLKQKPPYDLERGKTERELLSEEESREMWTLYEDSVKYVSEHPELYTAINAFDLSALLKETAP